MKSFDAFVIGGGPAGASAALLLARAGWSVALAEKTPFPRRKVCGEFISAASLPLLRELGIAGSFLARAGPEVRDAGLYAGQTMLTAAMPRPSGGADAYGRALAREHLDTMLLTAAGEAGAEVWQPWSAVRLARTPRGYACDLRVRNTREIAQFTARIVIAAHGSWESGALPTHQTSLPALGSDLFAFKAHFRNCTLPPQLMPLLVFPGGYGGMAHTDDGRASLSCCIRRDHLVQCRHHNPRMIAAQAVFAHIRSACRGAESAIGSAQLEGEWLAAGPIRPGIRPFRRDGIFTVGNAAGEAHPIVAEGISMALQSASLLCECLVAHRDAILRDGCCAEAARDYEAIWRRNFTRRIHAAACYAHFAMRPIAAAPVVALIKRVPDLLTLGAWWAGKAQPIRRPSSARLGR